MDITNLVEAGFYFITGNVFYEITVPCKKEQDTFPRVDAIGEPFEVAQNVTAGRLGNGHAANFVKFIAKNAYAVLRKGE